MQTNGITLCIISQASLIHTFLQHSVRHKLLLSPEPTPYAYFPVPVPLLTAPTVPLAVQVQEWELERTVQVREAQE